MLRRRLLPVAVLPICGILMGLGYALAPGVMGVPGAATSGAAYTCLLYTSIIDSRKDEVIAGVEKAGLAVVEVKEKRGWECIVCKKA